MLIMKHSLSHYNPWKWLDNATSFEMLNKNEVLEHFADTMDAYNNKKLCPSYTWPEVIWDNQGFAPERLNCENINHVITIWLKKFASMGIEISYEEIKPLIEDLRFGESRVLIVETAKAFIQFATSDYENRKNIRHQFILFEMIPKLEDLTPLYFMGNLMRSED